MAKGTVVALHGEHGQIMHEGNAYNFNIMIADGGIANQQEVEFEFTKDGKVKIIYGVGSIKKIKQTPSPKQAKKENTTSKLDTKVLITEEK